MDTGLGTINLYSACRVTASYLFTTPYQSQGTGFIVKLADGRLAVVTNRHVIEYPWIDPTYAGSVLQQVDLMVWRDTTTTQQLTLAPQAFRPHVDPTIDVAAAILDPNSTITAASPPNLEVGFWIDWGYINDQYWESVHLVEVGEPVMLPGYPEWFDRSAGRPIMRTGALVSDPQFDYRYLAGPPIPHDGNRQIIFEAFSTSGNSGGPVFVAQRGIFVKGGITYEGPYHPSMLVGINAGHYNDPTHGYHAGLSRMFKTSAILELLQTL